MNTVMVLLGLSITFAIAAPTVEINEARQLPALDHEEIHDEFGQYTLRYVTAEGTIVTETGRLVPNPDGVGFVMVVEGEVTYIGDDGKIYTTKYTAGFDGYKPQGTHLPVAPPMPPVDKVVPLIEAVVAPIEPALSPVKISTPAPFAEIPIIV